LWLRPDTLNLKITQLCDFFLRKEGAPIMANINAFTGVGVAGMLRTLHVAAAVAAAHPAFWAHAAAGAAAAIPPQPKRRTATATGKSVDRGTT